MGCVAEWLLRHVHRRVHLTLGFGRREPGPRLGVAASDMPAAVLRLERLRSERDHLSSGGGAPPPPPPPAPGGPPPPGGEGEKKHPTHTPPSSLLSPFLF